MAKRWSTKKVWEWYVKYEKSKAARLTFEGTAKDDFIGIWLGQGMIGKIHPMEDEDGDVYYEVEFRNGETYDEADTLADAKAAANAMMTCFMYKVLGVPLT